MAEPYLSEIRIFSFNFAPVGWAFCQGQTLPINQNTALFSLLGTTYGGNGTTNFSLPDLRGRLPIHISGTHVQGQSGGEETHVLAVAEMPAHTHPAVASSNPPNTADPTGAYWASNTGRKPYGSTPATAMSAGATPGHVGTSTGHENMPPYLTVNFCIAIAGIFPSRS